MRLRQKQSARTNLSRDPHPICSPTYMAGLSIPQPSGSTRRSWYVIMWDALQSFFWWLQYLRERKSNENSALDFLSVASLNFSRISERRMNVIVRKPGKGSLKQRMQPPRANQRKAWRKEVKLASPAFSGPCPCARSG